MTSGGYAALKFYSVYRSLEVTLKSTDSCLTVVVLHLCKMKNQLFTATLVGPSFALRIRISKRVDLVVKCSKNSSPIW